MTPSELAAWRKWMGYSQRDAAAALGVSLPTYQRWERGSRWKDGTEIELEKRVGLACAAIANGLDQFDPQTLGITAHPEECAG